MNGVAQDLSTVDSLSFHEYFLNLHVTLASENKICTRVDESWQARVCMRVFSTLMSWSNESKSCMRVDRREFV